MFTCADCNQDTVGICCTTIANNCVCLSKRLQNLQCVKYYTYLAIRLPCLAQPLLQKNVPDLLKIDTVDGGNILGHAVNVCPVKEKRG